MKVLTERDMINKVAKEWKESYFHFGEFSDEKSERIYNKLNALPANATAEMVTAITGYSYWITLSCDECGAAVKSAAFFEEYQNEFTLCATCLREALAKVEEAER